MQWPHPSREETEKARQKKKTREEKRTKMKAVMKAITENIGFDNHIWFILHMPRRTDSWDLNRRITETGKSLTFFICYYLNPLYNFWNLKIIIEASDHRVFKLIRTIFLKLAKSLWNHLVLPGCQRPFILFHHRSGPQPKTTTHQSAPPEAF